MKITRGDTKRLKFQRRKKDTLEPITTIPDKLYFTVKYSENDDDFIFQKTLGNDIEFNAEDNYYYFTIKPTDTDNLPYINLFYDIQVNDKGVKKTIATGSLNITEEVTFVSNEDEYNAELQDDSGLCAEEIITIEETDVIMNTDYSILDNKPRINDVELIGSVSLGDLGIIIPDVSDFITKKVSDLTNYTKTEDLEQEYAKKDEIPSTDEFITKSVNDLDNYELKENVGNELELSINPDNYVLTAKLNNSNGTTISTQEVDLPLEEMVINATYDNENKEIILNLKSGTTTKIPVSDLVKGLATTDYVDTKTDEETRDLLQTLSRELKPDEENGGFSSQTIVNVKNKSGATETIMEIDNLDVKTDVPTNSVLGTQKGIDMDERIGKLEKTPLQVIEIDSEMSNDEKTNHEYPTLELSEEQVKIILNNNISILKVHYNITERANGTETDTLVFYTTIDDENVVSGVNTVHTIKINAIRRNDEGILVYHGTMTGNGKEYYTKVNLTATWKE